MLIKERKLKTSFFCLKKGGIAGKVYSEGKLISETTDKLCEGKNYLVPGLQACYYFDRENFTKDGITQHTIYSIHNKKIVTIEAEEVAVIQIKNKFQELYLIGIKPNLLAYAGPYSGLDSMEMYCHGKVYDEDGVCYGDYLFGHYESDEPRYYRCQNFWSYFDTKKHAEKLEQMQEMMEKADKWWTLKNHLVLQIKDKLINFNSFTEVAIKRAVVRGKLEYVSDFQGKSYCCTLVPDETDGVSVYSADLSNKYCTIPIQGVKQVVLNAIQMPLPFFTNEGYRSNVGLVSFDGKRILDETYSVEFYHPGYRCDDPLTPIFMTAEKYDFDRGQIYTDIYRVEGTVLECIFRDCYEVKFYRDYDIISPRDLEIFLIGIVYPKKNKLLLLEIYVLETLQKLFSIEIQDTWENRLECSVMLDKLENITLKAD